MKTKLLVLLVAMFLSLGLHAQYNVASLKGNQLVSNFGGGSNTIGSPFLNSDWSEGKVMIADGQTSQTVDLHFNQMNSQLILRHEDNKAQGVVLRSEAVDGFQIGTKTGELLFVNISGEAFAEKKSGYRYYEQLDLNGDFIKDCEVEYENTEALMRGRAVPNLDTRNRYIRKYIYYIKGEKGEYVAVKLKTKEVLAAFPSRSKELAKKMKERKLKIKKERDVIAFLELL